MVMRPTCEAPGHWLSAKSAERQTATARGLPNTPSGKLISTSCAACGSPGLLTTIEVVRSGCAPASVLLVPRLNDWIAIGPAAWAGIARIRATTRANSVAVIPLAGIVIVSLLIVGASAMALFRVTAVLAGMPLDTALVLLDEASAAAHPDLRVGLRLLFRTRHRVDRRIRCGLGAGAMTLVR